MPEIDHKKVFEVHFRSVEELEKAYNEQISKGGYFVPTDRPHPRATPLDLRFFLPGLPEPLLVRAEVAFASETPIPGLGAGMAIQFEHLSTQINNAFRAAITVAKLEGMETGPGASGAHEVRAEPAAEPDPEPSFTPPDAAANDDDDELDEELDEEIVEDEKTSKDLMTMLSQQTTESLYGILRKLPIHQKVVAAKRGNRAVRAILLQEGNKKVMLFLLQNPQIGAAEVIQMLKMSNLSIETIQHVAKNSSFNQNEEIRYLITIHPKTPLPMALNQLNTLNVNNIARIAKAGFRAQLKSTALRLLEQRRK